VIINTINLLKQNCPELRVKITERLRKRLFFLLDNLTESLAQSLKINEITLRRKFFNREGYSFKLNELLFLAQETKIGENKIFSNITDIKIGHSAYWSNFPMKISADEEFTEGIGYYVGDGRSKTNRGLSTTNTDLKTIKFFLNWVKKYFNAEAGNININIFLPRSDFNINLEKRKWTKLLNININSVKSKYGYKNHHKIQIEVCYFRTIAKFIFDKLIPIIKEKCLTDKSFAAAYIRGIMTAEGSVRYNKKSHQRAIHLKMKSKAEVEYVFQLLRFMGLTPSFLFSKQDNEWLVAITGFDELKKLDKMNVFRSHGERKEKLKRILSNYHHQQTKKGRVKEFYLTKLFEFERKYGKYCTAKQLSKYVKRDKTRVVTVLRKLQKNKLVKGERIMKVGRPFKFTFTKTGKEFISKKPLSAYRLY